MIERIAIAEDAYLTCIEVLARDQPRGVTLDQNGALHVKIGTKTGTLNPTFGYDRGYVEVVFQTPDNPAA